MFARIDGFVCFLDCLNCIICNYFFTVIGSDSVCFVLGNCVMCVNLDLGNDNKF